ncbi:hypothetical protein M0802_015829 [Mischocyttarus mexicanus]|nr:hypothetical protein M0802_015829 [Mischocyttarus mexicanus]
MTGRRFEQLLRCINGHYTGHADSSTQKLNKIYPILQPILDNFQTAYSPSKALSLDESLLLFRGKSHNIEKTSKTSSLVLRLMQPYLNKGHHLFMENFYNSVELSKELLKHKTHTTGTLCPNPS